MSRPYFPAQLGAPPPLRLTVERRVRFEEVDPLNIVWHGRYASFFEDARVALGDSYGIGYFDWHREGILTPIKNLHLDYLRPLSFPERFSIEAILHFSEAARLNFEFIVRNDRQQVTTTGYSVQMMVDLERNFLLTPPPFLRGFLERWQKGDIA